MFLLNTFTGTFLIYLFLKVWDLGGSGHGGREKKWWQIWEKKDSVLN